MATLEIIAVVILVILGIIIYRNKVANIILLLIIVGMEASAQGHYTREYSDQHLNKTAQKWLKKGTWRNGFQKASPHASVNAVEFYQQYQRNPAQWEALFRWLADTDLLQIAKGKHPIEGTQLVVSVEDSNNAPLEKRNSESHFQHIDLQYVVKGTERFGIIDQDTSTPKDLYKPDVIHYNYDAARTRFYDSNPDEFFIFFPCDWHIAKIESPLVDDQSIRVIVIKVDYICQE